VFITNVYRHRPSMILFDEWTEYRRS